MDSRSSLVDTEPSRAIIGWKWVRPGTADMVQQHLNGRKGREGPVGAKSAGVLVPPSGAVVSPQKIMKQTACFIQHLPNFYFFFYRFQKDILDPFLNHKKLSSFYMSSTLVPQSFHPCLPFLPSLFPMPPMQSPKIAKKCHLVNWVKLHFQ